MATMSCRTTFALAATAIERLNRLSSRWRVSQAEVIRRFFATSNVDDFQLFVPFGLRLKNELKVAP